MRIVRCPARTLVLAQFPGQAPESVVDFNGSDAINDNGDVLATVELPDPFRGVSNSTLYAYLAAEDQLVRVIGPGDIVDGMQLIQARILVPPSDGGFGGTFENDRSFVANLRLRPLGDLTSGAADTWGLYDLRVTVPEPSGAIVVMIAAVLSVSRRRGRRGRWVA
ncbi:MAG: hypothetical protein H7Z14_17705 [Anaerolineae bacterium]|nr:hypothetical protein [Phycisphaerae bacterium]